MAVTSPIDEYVGLTGDPELLAIRERAACRGMDPGIFFPERGSSAMPAKTVCMVCPCRAACLAYALRHHEREGVWGGTSEKDRRKLLRRQRVEQTSCEAVAESEPLPSRCPPRCRGNCPRCLAVRGSYVLPA